MDDSPQHTMNIRAIDDRQIDLHDHLREKTLTSFPFSDALRDAPPDAIYHHQKERSGHFVNVARSAGTRWHGAGRSGGNEDDES